MRAKYWTDRNLPVPETVRHCKRCGAEFTLDRDRRVYCSQGCKKIAVAEADKLKKRVGIPFGSKIACRDCGGDTIREAWSRGRCLPCQEKWDAGRSRRCRERNPDRQRALDTAAAARRRATKEGAEAYRQQCREWRALPKNKLRGRVTAMMNRCLASGKQGRSWVDLVPYGMDELRDHIERQFTKGMTWENMGDWHVDHIVPVASFNFTSPEDDEFKACFALTNLRPMWARENQRKSAKRIYLI